MIDFGEPVVLEINGNVRLAAAVDLAAGRGNLDTLGQALVDKILVKNIHEGLDGAGGIRARKVAVKPSLGMDDIGNRRSRPSYRKAEHIMDLLNQGINILFVRKVKLDVTPACET
jgi:hypothetical protein